MPTLNVGGWYDQEDFRGPLRIYELLEKHDTKNQNFLVVGPWNHGGWAAGRANRTRPRAVRLRYRRVLPREGAGPVLRLLSQGQGQSAAGRGADVPDRREQVGKLRCLAAEERRAAQALPPRQRQARLRRRRTGRDTRSTNTSPIPPTRCRIARGRSGRPIPAPSGRSGWSRTSASRIAGPMCSPTRPNRSPRTWSWPVR